LSLLSDVLAEKAHQEHLAGIEHSQRSKLKRTATTEKIVLPSSEDIATEKTHLNLCQGIEGFDKSRMQHAETAEKIALPGKE
ncbi:Beta-thymosin, partial [Trinorchestia longiramus]